LEVEVAGADKDAAGVGLGLLHLGNKPEYGVTLVVDTQPFSYGVAHMLGATLQVVGVELGRRVARDDDQQRVVGGLRPPGTQRGFYGGVVFVCALGALPEMLVGVGLRNQPKIWNGYVDHGLCS
jgi:hypothetical protein